VCGERRQAIAEATLAQKLGYHAALLSLAALKNASVPELIDHSRAIAEIIPVVGFYLQPAVGGCLLPYEFWCEFAAIPNIVAIKVAPFNRYQTLDVVRAVVESGRSNEIALYTGNDDNIVVDLLTEFNVGGSRIRFAGGLLGHWAVWTRSAACLLARIKDSLASPTADLLTIAQQVTDMNAAIFDARNGFRGCIAGIHEVLRRQGLLEGTWCLDPTESLSAGQADEISRVLHQYPHLHQTDNELIAKHLDEWLR
jgi:dihydrodipicolinate synthase/N-acetylneuraminate lyase